MEHDEVDDALRVLPTGKSISTLFRGPHDVTFGRERVSGGVIALDKPSSLPSCERRGNIR
jgi:hypothetical protein